MDARMKTEKSFGADGELLGRTCNLPERRVVTLLERVEAQICRDILRLRQAIGDQDTPRPAQERFHRLIAKREEMLKSVRAQLCAGF